MFTFAPAHTAPVMARASNTYTSTCMHTRGAHYLDANLKALDNLSSTADYVAVTNNAAAFLEQRDQNTLYLSMACGCADELKVLLNNVCLYVPRLDIDRIIATSTSTRLFMLLLDLGFTITSKNATELAAKYNTSVSVAQALLDEQQYRLHRHNVEGLAFVMRNTMIKLELHKRL